jgi:hypothetical protein
MLSSNNVVETQLDHRLSEIEEEMSGNVLAYYGPIYGGVDVLIRNAIEKIQGKKDKLVVILETEGGYIEVAQRIVNTMRHHFPKNVEFIIPDHAMSAGTVIVMSGNAIHMDYFSTLSPIDPQIQRPDGNMIPGLGYLIQYDRLIKKSKKGKLTMAELQYLIEKFDPAELYSYEQARELSIALLKEWLVKYKFNNWNKTATRKIKVTQKMKTGRAEFIAKRLNDTNFWHSHGHGISMEVLRRELKLIIEDFGAKRERNNLIREYHKLLTDYMNRLNSKIAVHVRGAYTSI